MRSPSHPSLLVLVFFVLLMLVAPAPVFVLLSALQPAKFAVGFMALVKPAAIGSILAVIPVVVVAMLGVVVAAVTIVLIPFVFFSLLRILRRGLYSHGNCEC
jgi:hypothetical protein